MKRIFLTFAAQDLEKAKEVVALFLEAGFPADFYALPADITDTNKIRQGIGGKIVKSEITLCLITEDTAQDPWVDCALRKSFQKGNRIIAMALKGTESAVLPELIRENNLTFYPWNPEKLVELIK